MTQIPSQAFLNCEALKTVIIPARVQNIEIWSLGYTEYIDEDFFARQEKVEGFTIYGAAGSAAQSYASSNGFTFAEMTAAQLEVSQESYTETFEQGKTFRLNVTTGSGCTLSYSSDNENVVTVDQEGQVTIQGTGDANITVMASGEGKLDNSKSIPVRINAADSQNPVVSSDQSISIMNNTGVFYLYLPDPNLQNMVTNVSGMNYDKQTNTLTLTNYTGNETTLSIQGMGDFKLSLAGTNELGSISVMDQAFNAVANLTITGDGSLFLNKANIYSPAIFMRADSSRLRVTEYVNMTVNAGTVADNAEVLSGAIGIVGTSASKSEAVVIDGNVTGGLTIIESNLGTFQGSSQNGSYTYMVKNAPLVITAKEKTAPPVSTDTSAGTGTAPDTGTQQTETGHLEADSPDNPPSGPDGEEETLTVGTTETVGGATYKVTESENGKMEVAYVSTKKSAKKVAIPSTVTIDGETCTVTAVADNAFSGNKTLTSVTIPATVQEIGSNAFKNCTKLKTVTIPKKVDRVGKNAFSGCTNLTTVTVKGTSLANVDQGAFKNCKKLTNVTLPKSVKTIGKEAFSGCKKLKKLTIKSTNIKSVGKNAFKNLPKTATIKVPAKKKAAYKKMFKKAGFKGTVK